MSLKRIALWVSFVFLSTACESKVSRTVNQAVEAGGSGSGGSGASDTTSPPAPPVPKAKVYKTFAYLSSPQFLSSFAVDAATGDLLPAPPSSPLRTIWAAADPLGKY